jgi:DNA-binding response OmpR family regulator
MDLHMPIMDGYSATQQIRQWETENNKARLPIIALTADAFEEDRQRCLAVGMDDFLTKPIAITALQTALAKWLRPAPGELPATPSSAPAIKLVDEVRLLALVDEITPLLAQNKFDALACFDQLRALAAGTAIATEIETIGNLLKAFQFDLALTRLQSTVAQQTKNSRE